jgi:Domain of unknown function (DUF4386)
MSGNYLLNSQQLAARVVGINFLLAIAIVVFANYGISFRLLIPGDAESTARNIIENETLFRLNIACNLAYVINVVILISGLYVVLKSAGQFLAIVAAVLRLIYGVMWAVTALNMLGALRILGEAVYLSAFGSDQLQTLARLQISIDGYYIGLPFWGLSSAICSYLWLKSNFIPRALAIFGLGSSVWCLICSLAFVVYPRVEATVNAYLFDMPLVLFETAIGVWLLSKGLRGTSNTIAR